MVILVQSFLTLSVCYKNKVTGKVKMAGSVNKVILIGNLGRDPEVRSTQSGGKIVNLSIATSERWKDRVTNEQQERTEWHRVVIFNEALGRIAEQYLKKGSTCHIEGQIQTRKWTDEQGLEKYSTEVVLQQFRGELTLLGSGGDKSGRNLPSVTDDSTNPDVPKKAPRRFDGDVPF